MSRELPRRGPPSGGRRARWPRRTRAAWLGICAGLSARLLGCGPELSAPELGLPELNARGLPLRLADCDGPPLGRIGIPAAVLDRHFPLARPLPVPTALASDLRQAIEQLPEPLARAFDRHVCRIVLVSGLRVGGTLKMLPADPTRGSLILNLDYLELSADTWMSFKEASFFEPEPGLAITAHMASDDDRIALLEFLLTHELGHVLHSAFDDDPLIARFLAISWPRRDPYAVLSLIPYAELRGQLTRSEFLVEPLYEMVAASSFPSLSAAMNENEDFADSLATYSQQVLSNRPSRVEVWRGEQLSWRLDGCWNEPRCQEKRTALEAFLGRFMP